MKKFTAKERQIMDILYATPGVPVKEVQNKLADGSSYSSVRASLSRLVDKGILRAERQGSKHLYCPAEDPNDVSQTALKHVMSTFFKDSPAATISAVLQFSDAEIDADELDKIRNIIEASERADG